MKMGINFKADKGLGWHKISVIILTLKIWLPTFRLSHLMYLFRNNRIGNFHVSQNLVLITECFVCIVNLKATLLKLFPCKVKQLELRRFVSSWAQMSLSVSHTTDQHFEPWQSKPNTYYLNVSALGENVIHLFIFLLPRS